MKQQQLIYQNKQQFSFMLSRLNSENHGNIASVRIFYDQSRLSDLKDMIAVIESVCPNAEYYGCSSNANIEQGRLAEGTLEAVVTVFEHEDSKLKVLTYPLDEDSQKQLCDDLLEQVAAHPWVKGIEVLVTIRDISTTYFCDRLSEMNDSIAIFGGCAFSKSLDRNDVSVLSKQCGIVDSGIVFVLMGGQQLNIWTTYISGWKPLGQKLDVTKAEGNRLYEINGKPAYETYYRYLKIDNDEFFYYNTLEFPIAYERNGTSILRVPSACMEDGSLIMTADVDSGSAAQITYGDPQTILRSIFDKAKQLADFVPEGIVIYDCASRRSFWGSEDIDRESMPFSALADTAGFYTAGEFHRMGHSLNQHNVTLVIVGMREGEPGESKKENLIKGYDYTNEHVSMVRRLANFIDVASKELEAANKRLADANELLTRIATSDELTGLYNRREIKKRIIACAELHASDSYSLIMLDLDNFKNINDTYGHSEGDRVLRRFADLLIELILKTDSGSVGRWGGEEFMVLLPNTPEKDAFKFAEKIRTRFAETHFEVSGLHTVSCGVTVGKQNETSDEACIRVDRALYKSKENGRNRTSIL